MEKIPPSHRRGVVPRRAGPSSRVPRRGTDRPRRRLKLVVGEARELKVGPDYREARGRIQPRFPNAECGVRNVQLGKCTTVYCLTCNRPRADTTKMFQNPNPNLQIPIKSKIQNSNIYDRRLLGGLVARKKQHLSHGTPRPGSQIPVIAPGIGVGIWGFGFPWDLGFGVWDLR